MDLSLEVKCRACLAESVPLLNLFDVYEHDITLAVILQSCIDTEVNENDGLPKYLCESCISTLTEFYNFSIIYEQSVAQLKATIEQKEHFQNRNNKINHNVEDEHSTDGTDGTYNLESCSLQNNFSLELEDGVEKLYKTLSEKVSLEDKDRKVIYVKAEDIPNDSEEVIESYEDDYGSELDESPSSIISDKKEEERVFFESENGELLEQITKYECKECGDTFLYPSGITFHMLKRHNLHDIDVKQYSTKVILKVKNKSNPTKEDDIYIYPNDLTSDETGCFKCQLCRAIFDSNERLKEHQMIHKTYVCEVCGSSYIKKSYLEDHKEAHSSDKRYKCKFCNKCFKRRTVLVKHKRIHTHPRQCVCEICGKRFNDKGTLKTHTLLLHIKERKFKCVICGKNFPLKATLDKHVRRHVKREKGEKDFQCDRCEMSYRDKSSLTRHIATKHSGVDCKVTCQDCGKVYTSTTNLFKHRRLHHKELMLMEEEDCVKLHDCTDVLDVE